MQLRDYQDAMLQKASQYMRQGKRRILLRLATGGGKTVMAAAMLGSAGAKGMTSDFIVHRRELIEQTSDTFRAVGIPHGFIASGMPSNGLAPVQLAGIQTLVNRLDHAPVPKLIVWDECHHMTAGLWDRVFNEYPDAFHIGLTATPERLDGRGLSDHFDVMVDGPSTGELIRRGFLSPFDYYAPGIPDLVGMRTLGGDYNRSDTAALMGKPKVVGDVIEHYLRFAKGEAGIVFAASRDNSRALAEAFTAEGIRAGHVDGSMAMRERKRIVDAFKARDIDIMTNVDLFGEGFDVPAMVYCGLVRPTKSLALHLQQCGRALRINEGKGRAIICDHAGNALSGLGLPDDERVWTLEGRKKGTARKVSDDATSIQQCPECYRVTASVVKVCPCGHEFVIRSRDPVFEDGQLFKLERVDAKAEKARAAHARKMEERDCKDYSSLKELAEKRGYEKPAGWARMKLQQREQYRYKFSKGGKR
jgi:DNA repair protein RadD